MTAVAMVLGGRQLPRSFFARPSLEVAPALLGLLLVRPDRGLVARIVETEAYAQDDPACHAHRGRTPANRVLFGPPGHAYVYFTYGMHHCANVVTGRNGVGEGVLLRAATPVAGVPAMRAARGRRGRDYDGPVRDLLRGPARLAAAFGLDRSHSGMDLLEADGVLRILDDGMAVDDVARGPRVGVRLAADLPWRFWRDGDVHVSRYVRHRRAAPKIPAE